MKFRHTLGLVAGIAAIGLTLAACSSGGSAAPSASSTAVDGKGKTITFFTAVNTTYPQQQQAFFKKLTAAFEKTTGAKLDIETYTSSADEVTKIQTSAVSGQGPDVYDIGTTLTPTAYSTGAFVTLSDADWKTIGGRDRFVPASLGISGPSKDKLIAVPWQSRPYVMVYNTKLFAAAGYDKPAATWDGLIAQAKKMTGNGVYGMAIDYKDVVNPWKYIWTFDRQSGNPIVSGKTAKIDSDTTKQAYKSYFGLLTDDKVVDPASVGWTGPQALADFAAGKAAMFPMTGATAQNTLNASPVKSDYKFAVMPLVPPGHDKLPKGGVPAASILSGNSLTVADYSPNKQLAFQLVKYLTSDEIQQEQYADFGNLPVTAKAAASLQKSQPQLGPVLEAGKKSYATPFTGAWGDIQLALLNVVTQSIPSLANGSVSDSQLSSLLSAAQHTATTSLKQAP